MNMCFRSVWGMASKTETRLFSSTFGRTGCGRLPNRLLRPEYRVMIPSASVRSHAELPEMQAKTITDRVMVALGEGLYDFILFNYANPDMVAHTGDVAATV